MSAKTLRDLQAATQYRKFSSEQDLDAFLDERFPRASAEERIGMKLSLQASGKFRPSPSMRAVGELGTDQPSPRGTLATDRQRYTPAAAPVGGEMKTLLRRAKLSVQESYSENTIDELLDKAGLGVTDRIAVKHALGEAGCIRRR